MRNDMAKVIVERPRVGGEKVTKGRTPRDLENLPARKGLRRAVQEAGDWKELNENLAPLRRYLASQVGRPWNKVWSEICANLRPTSTVQQHVRDHVFDFVAVRNLHVCGGEFYVSRRWGGSVLLAKSHYEFWVDPRSGILRRNRGRDRYRKVCAGKQRDDEKKLRQRMVAVSQDLQYHCLDDGGWWEVKLAPVPTEKRPQRFYGGVIRYCDEELPVLDVVLNAGLSHLSREELYDRKGVYATAKQQLSKKDIKRLALR